MTQTIKISNGDTLHFPDGMSDEQIQAAIHKEYGLPQKEQREPTFWQKMGPGGEKYLSEDEKNKIMNSDVDDTMNMLTAGLPVGQAAKLLGKGAGTLAKGAANAIGRVGQSAGYAGLESWAKGHNPMEAGGMAALLQGGLESAIPGLKIGGALVGRLAKSVGGEKTASFIDKAKEHLGISNLKKHMQNMINDHIENRSQKPGGPRSPEQAKQMMQEQYTDVHGNPMPVDIGSLTGEPRMAALHNTTKHIPMSGTGRNINEIEQKQSDVERAGLEKQQEEEQKNITAQQQAAQQEKQRILSEANPHRDAHENLSEQLRTAISHPGYKLEAPQAGNELLEHLGQGTNNKEESARKLATMIREKHNERVEESSQFFKHVFKKDIKLYEKPDPLITTKLDKEMDILKRLKGMNVEPLYYKFKKNASIENGHWLKSELGTVVGDLERNTAKTPADRATIANINNVRKTIETDIHDALKRHDLKSNENLLPMYKKGVELHKENVEPFRSTPKLREITVKGKETPKNIETIFDTPSNIVKENGNKIGPINKVIKDLPEEAKNLILHNKIGANAHINNHENLVNALHKAKNEGFSTYFNSHVNESIRNIENKAKSDAENESFIKLNEQRIKSLNREIKSHESKINNIETKADKVKEVPNESTLSENIVKKLKENEQKRLEMSPKGGKPLGWGAGITAFGIKSFPKTAAMALILGKPVAELLRDPKMLQSYIDKQPLAVKISLLTKIKELSPKILAPYIQGSNNNGS